MIDIHVHCAKGEYSGNYKWVQPSQLLEMMDDNGLEQVVIQSLITKNLRMDTPEILECCKLARDRMIPFMAITPEMGDNDPDYDFAPMINQYVDAGCKGVGEFVPNLAFDDPLLMNIFKHIEAARLPVLFHIAPDIGQGHYGCFDELGLPRLETVLKSFPDLVIIGHSQPFWSEISADNNEQTRNTYPKGVVQSGRLISLMKQYPNLHADLSGMSGFNAISRDPEFGYSFLEEFQNQIYFGTDICNYQRDLPIVPYFQKLKQEQLISETAFEKITRLNALRIVG